MIDARRGVVNEWKIRDQSEDYADQRPETRRSNEDLGDLIRWGNSPSNN